MQNPQSSTTPGCSAPSKPVFRKKEDELFPAVEVRNTTTKVKLPAPESELSAAATVRCWLAELENRTVL